MERGCRFAAALIYTDGLKFAMNALLHCGPATVPNFTVCEHMTAADSTGGKDARYRWPGEKR
jgi:hypothetical protein